jgi:putative ABC transport system permease protein
MFRTALRNVFAHKARLLMTVLAVLLGVAFVSGTLIFTTTVSEAYTRSAEKSFDRLDVQLRPAKNAGGHDTGRLLDQDLLQRVDALPGATSATGVVSGFAALAGKDGKLVGEGWPTRGTNYAGADDPRYPMAEGRPPAAAGEIAIDAHTAERTGHRVGDTIRLSVSGPVIAERVTGIFTTDDGSVAAGGTLTLFDTATAQSLFAEPGRYNQIELRTQSGTPPDLLRQQAESIVPHGVEAVTVAELSAEQAGENAANISSLSQVLLVCAGVSLFVGVFLIVNTFTMLIAQRSKELALLRAVGATRRQVTLSVLAEAAVVGLIAGAAGLVAGIGIAAAVRAVLSSGDGTLPDGPLVIGTTPIVAALALGLGVTVLAAWLPARRAAKISPVAAMSSVYAPATTQSLVVRNTVGGILAVGGAALVVAASGMTGGKPWLALGAVVLLVGVLVLTPLLSRPAITATGPLLRRFGVVGRLAGQNAVRNPRRSAATASALTIGLTLIASLSVVGASADKAVHELAATGWVRADYMVSMANAGPLAVGTETKLRELPEVTAASPRREVPARVDGVDQTVVGFRTAEIDQLIDMNFTTGTFVPGDTAVVDEETAIAKGWQPGDTVEVIWPDGARSELELTGFYQSAFDEGLKTDIAVIDPHLDRIADGEVMVKVEGGVSEAAQHTLEQALGDSPAIRIQDRQELADTITGTVGLILNILYGMLALAVVVAVLGVINTLALSVHERAQEIGLLRAIGLDRTGVKRMIRLESMVISLFGGVLGVGLGVFLGWALGELVSTLGIDTWSLVVPWGRLALVLSAAAVVGVVAALWPARRAANLNVLDAIKTE